MNIVEFVGMLCEAVDEHRDNFYPVPSDQIKSLTATELAEHNGGIACSVHLTPSGEISAEPAGVVCSFCVRPKPLNAKPSV